MLGRQRLDAALLERVASGDPRAYRDIVERHVRGVHAFVYRMLGSRAEAEEVCQESFLRLWQQADTFVARAKPSTWLYRVAYNASIDHLRKHRPAEPLIDDTGSDEQTPLMPAIVIDWSQAPETLFASIEAQAELDRCILQLPERLHSTFMLREIEGLSTAETAEILGIKPGAVKVQLHRARLLLRECLATYFGERLAAAQEKE